MLIPTVLVPEFCPHPLCVFVLVCFYVRAHPRVWASVYNERVPYCVYIQMGLGNSLHCHSFRVQTPSPPARSKRTQTTVKTSHTRTHTASLPLSHRYPLELRRSKKKKERELPPSSMAWQASSKGYLSAQCVSTFLICIIYYGQNQNREHSHGQYYVLAQWLLLKRTPVSWIHMYAYSHTCTIADTCLHTQFAPTGPLPEKPCVS